MIRGAFSLLALSALISSPAMAQPVPGAECMRDIDCNDGNIYTMNWCDGYDCHSVERAGNECTEAEWSWCFWDDQCDDGNADTVDWCDFGTCRNHRRSSRPGNCDAPKFCNSDQICDDGNADTINWCHEFACRSVQREDPTCDETVEECTSDQDCAAIAQKYNLVSWCQDQKCHINKKEAVDECVEVGNLKPDY